MCNKFVPYHREVTYPCSLSRTTCSDYYYYSHIFPGFRAKHCNYATLLAGRCSNNLWCSVIFPKGPSFLSMLVFGVRMHGFLRTRCIIFLDFTLLLSPLWTCPSSVRCLFLGVAACIGLRYFAMVLLCAVCRGRFGLLLLVSGGVL